MKILLATIFTLPSTGGLWTYVEQLKASLEKEGHEVDILAHHPRLQSYYLFNNDIEKQFNIREARNRLKPIYAASFNRITPKVDPQIIKLEMVRQTYAEAASHFGLEKYDLIHAQDIISSHAIARQKPYKTPLILTVHGCYTTELFIAGLIKQKDSAFWKYSSLLEYYGVASADFTILPSHYMKDTLVNEFHVPQQNLKVIPNGMNVPIFLEKMMHVEDLPQSEGKKVIACVARLNKIKGHECLLGALTKLKKNRTDWVCWLVGDGDLDEELHNRVGGLELQGYVTFLGARKDVAGILKHADICVLPSLQENCPYSIMEAQVAGKCVVATSVGGIPEMIVHGQTGLLFNPGDEHALYKHLTELLDDKEYRNSMADNAMEWGRVHWSLERINNDTLSIYKAALNKKNRIGFKDTLDIFQDHNKITDPKEELLDHYIQLVQKHKLMKSWYPNLPEEGNPILEHLSHMMTDAEESFSLLNSSTGEIPDTYFFSIIKALTLLTNEEES